MKGREIRKKFLKYFEERGHQVVESSSLVPHGDPTLLFTNAGMVQFKNVFLGLEKRPYQRATTAQKCVRAGGKHNDLDSVGRTPRHHTFFEMLGNFSFGDYFKREAIIYAYEFLTEVLGLPKERLWATIYQEDDEAFNLWKELTAIPEARIVRLGTKDNFWAMGDTGPCGPCSEIVYDQGQEYRCEAPECAIGVCDCDRWLELWNLVFMQYDRDENGKMTPLPKPSIDTGLGLERIASVLQGVDTNFETDLIRPVISRVEALTGCQYHPDHRGFPFRVIADHARACTFLVADGVLPSNEGRGYVLRRILRRAVRFGRDLGVQGPFLHQVTPVVVDLMGEAYPELVERKDHVMRVIELEEKRFGQTLDEGMKMVAEILDRLKTEGRSQISGREAFILYDTYGFPVDLTEDVARENGFTVDRFSFEKAMEEQRSKGRAARDDRLQEVAVVTAALGEVGATEFVGYEELEVQATVVALTKGSEMVEAAVEGDEVQVFVDKTPFYAEGGGQVADTGLMECEGFQGRVTQVQRVGSDKVLHRVKVTAGLVKARMKVMCRVDVERRKAVARNHTATHLLHQALKKVLGEHVNQRGSLVAPDRLRFDFSHLEALREEEIQAVEDLVNEKVRENIEVTTYVTTYEKAREEGAIALFGEKYAGQVRVVRMGDFSSELCGGTHLDRTGELGFFKILSETGVGTGLRRIEAVSGAAALAYIRQEERELAEIGKLVKAAPGEILERTRDLVERAKALEREVNRLKSKLAAAKTDDLLKKAVRVNGIKVVAARAPVSDMENLRHMADIIKNKVKSGVVVLGAPSGGKVSLVAMVTEDLVSRGLHAGRLIGEIAKVTEGGGGGRPDMAQAGGKNPDRLQEALDMVTEQVKAQLVAVQ